MGRVVRGSGDILFFNDLELLIHRRDGEALSEEERRQPEEGGVAWIRPGKHWEQAAQGPSTADPFLAYVVYLWGWQRSGHPCTSERCLHPVSSTFSRMETGVTPGLFAAFAGNQWQAAHCVFQPRCLLMSLPFVLG